MNLGLQDKTALVMSSSRGFGEEIAKALALEGVHVLLTASLICFDGGLIKSV